MYPTATGRARRTAVPHQLEIEVPIFAFTHCRDVAAAVTNAGGLGVLGAVGFSAEQLEVELAWLDEHVGDRPYGVDLVIPEKYEGMGIDNLTPDELAAELGKHVPEGHREFAAKLLADHGVPELPLDPGQHQPPEHLVAARRRLEPQGGKTAPGHPRGDPSARPGSATAHP